MRFCCLLKSAPSVWLIFGNHPVRCALDPASEAYYQQTFAPNLFKSSTQFMNFSLHSFLPYYRMKTKCLDDENVRAWQRTSSTTEHLIRCARVFYVLGFLPLNLLLISADVFFGKTDYGLRPWSWKTRTFRFLIANVVWALNPGTRPVMDVLSKKARSGTGSLKPDQGAHRASYVEVPP